MRTDNIDIDKGNHLLIPVYASQHGTYEVMMHVGSFEGTKEMIELRDIYVVVKN